LGSKKRSNRRIIKDLQKSLRFELNEPSFDFLARFSNYEFENILIGEIDEHLQGKQRVNLV